jgi:pSer/pThr/pTyr-binding forkhead associated (FHA) protein
MPRLIVKADDRVLKDYVVGAMAMIGRRADNTIVIDDPAVSGHHACVFRDGDHDVLKDLESTNGTFVNHKRVRRHQLRNGDVVKIGKHTIVFAEIDGEEPIEADASATLMSNPADTVFLDAKKHQALLALLKEVDAEMAAATRTGVLRVLAGENSQAEYRLEAETSIIGKSDEAVLRLRGWFKPKVAVAIARNSDGYVATLMGGKTLVNGQPLGRRHLLQDGDVLEVNGLRLEFRLMD